MCSLLEKVSTKRRVLCWCTSRPCAASPLRQPCAAMCGHFCGCTLYVFSLACEDGETSGESDRVRAYSVPRTFSTMGTHSAWTHRVRCSMGTHPGMQCHGHSPLNLLWIVFLCASRCVCILAFDALAAGVTLWLSLLLSVCKKNRAGGKTERQCVMFRGVQQQQCMAILCLGRPLDEKGSLLLFPKISCVSL